MRKVYTPPTQGGGWSATVLGSIGITLAVFLILPLTQMISSYAKRELLLRPTEALVLQTPTDLQEPPPPPPEPEPEPEPEPQLGDSEQPLNLSVDLDVAVGTGGALSMASLATGQDLAEEMAEALDVADLDKPPTLMASVPPVYPAALRRAKVPGTVVLVFVLSEEGRVDDPRVESSTHPEFAAPALDAVKRWRFRPGEKRGEPVRTYMRLPIRFSVAG